MAFQAKRAKQQIETFELVDDTGAVVHRYDVRTDTDHLAKRLSRIHIELAQALTEGRKIQERAEADSNGAEDAAKAYEMIGTLVMDALQLVFGVEDAKEIISFYEDNYAEMCQEVVIPFVFGVVLARARAVDQERRKQVMRTYAGR